MAVFLVPLVFIRLYAPMQYLPGVIIMNARLFDFFCGLSFDLLQKSRD